MTIIGDISLSNERDIVKIESQLRAGRILFIKTKDYFVNNSDNLLVLKNSLERIRDVCAEMGGSIARLDETILIASPHPNIKF